VGTGREKEKIYLWKAVYWDKTPYAFHEFEDTGTNQEN
jgi:hypothetical protein